MNYICLVNGIIEYASTDPKHFAHYRLIYSDEHKDADPQYFALTDEQYDKLFSYDENDQ